MYILKVGEREAIRQDREPGFMSDFLYAYNQIVSKKQRSTMACRPQANGTEERMVHTLSISIKIYESDENQRDWD